MEGVVNVLVFDIETNGFLDNVTVIHTLCIYDTETRVYTRYDKTDVPKGIAKLERAEEICGHNIIKFDIPVIQKLYPLWKCPPCVVDTLIWARVAFPEVKETDFALWRSGRLPGKLIGRHSLEAWGYRVFELKGDYGKNSNDYTWERWTPAMSDYCEQDVRVTVALVKRLEDAQVDPRAFALEHEVGWIIARQERFGFPFIYDKAIKLYAMLSRQRSRLLERLAALFPPFYWPGKEFIPKSDSARFNYHKGAAMTKCELVDFNPASNLHVAHVFKKLYGWEPTEFTEKTNEPVISDEVLEGLTFPGAKLIAAYRTVNKRIAQLAEGAEAWMKHVKPDGRIHGTVDSNGAVSGRMTHFKPNVAQVPSVDNKYGKLCRSLFVPPPGWIQVGIDASSLEARCLAHFLAYYDNGAYVEAVVNGENTGDLETSTDFHSINAKALGVSRPIAKRFIYAWLYGAGNPLIASILGISERAAKKKVGEFIKKIAALGQLKAAIDTRIAERGYLIGLDGRRLASRSAHSALNLLLQSAGAVVMKQALVFMDSALAARGFKPGVDYEFMANVHDEFQVAARNEELAELVGRTGIDAIRRAGEHFKLNCPLDGGYRIGRSWRETH